MRQHVFTGAQDNNPGGETHEDPFVSKRSVALVTSGTRMGMLVVTGNGTPEAGADRVFE